MMRIITDSASDILPEEALALGVELLPIRVRFGEEEFPNGLSHEEFYGRLRTAKELPATAQLNPNDFAEIFRKYAGDELLCILLSSKLSGTFQSALIAKMEAGDGRIHVLDSAQASFGLGFLVREAAKLRDSGAGAAEIIEKIEALSPRLRLFAVVGTLKYLKMGGRLSAASAIVGEVLGINPIVSIVEGRVEAVAKARGERAAYGKILELMEKSPPDYAYPLAFGHSDAPDRLVEFLEFLRPHLPESAAATAQISGIGSVVGTHAGPGAAGIAYIAAE